MTSFEDVTKEEIEAAKERLNQMNKERWLTVYEFQKLVEEGKITDSNTIAQIAINGAIHSGYNVYIDKRCITKEGSLISALGLVKMYGLDNIKINCIEREGVFT